MKKILLTIVLLFTGLFSFGCANNQYKEEAGLYSLYSMSGDLSISQFEFYTIDLRANGTLSVNSQGKGNPSSTYHAEATFNIVEGKITIYTKVSASQDITEVYDYVNSEIHMNNVSSGGITFTAKFRRAPAAE